MRNRVFIIVIIAVALFAAYAIFYNRTTNIPSVQDLASPSPMAGDGVEEVTVYLVAVGEGSGEDAFGCDDTLVPVVRDIEPTQATLTASIRELISMGEPEAGGRELYNVFADSDLHLEGAVIEEGTAVIRLSGELMLGGVCDEPRVREQLTRTALQYDTVDEVEIFINGESLESVLSSRG